jgi:hypothetical protein
MQKGFPAPVPQACAIVYEFLESPQPINLPVVYISNFLLFFPGFHTKYKQEWQGCPVLKR